MAISFQGANGGAGSSVAIPAHQAGDLLVVFCQAQSGGLPTAPAAGGTVPTWTAQGGAGGSFSNCRIFTAVATSSSHTTGSFATTWSIIAAVVRGQKVSGPVGGLAYTGEGTGAAIPMPGVTLSKSDGSSLLLYFTGAGDSTGNQSGTWSAAPAGWTARYDQNGYVTSCSVMTKDVSTAAGASSRGISPGYSWSKSATVEILAGDATSQFFHIF